MIISSLFTDSTKEYISEIGAKMLGSIFDISTLSLRSLTNGYVLIGLAISVLAVIFFVKQGYHNGLVKELASIISLLAAALCFGIIVDIVNLYTNGKIFGIITAVISLAIVSAVYGIIKMIFSILHIFSRLPVIRILDNVLGIAGGLVEGVIFVSMVKYLLTFFDIL